MTVQVVTVYTPRPRSEQWMDYLPLIRAQRASALRFGHRHLVVTDVDLGSEFETMRTQLPENLMQAMIAGVVARLAVPTVHNTVFVDADCLVARELDSAFIDNYDIGLTHRFNPVSPINNGVMYVMANSFAKAHSFYKYALSICGTHWGGDQEAISDAASPVPEQDGYGIRFGCNIKFMNMKRYAAVPKEHLSKHGAESYVIHFKGKTKEWMLDYANAYILAGEHGHR